MLKKGFKMFVKSKDRVKAKKFGKKMATASFVTRLFLLYIPYWFLIFVAILILADAGNSGSNVFFVKTVANIVGFPISIAYLGLIAAIIPILIEMNNRKWRRKHGWSIYKSVEKDYQRMLIENKLKLEQEAKQNLGIDESSGAVDKTDIRYWHGLLKDGIIDQEEFDKKKKELV